MRRLIDWVKRNKLATALGLILLYLLFRSFRSSLLSVQTRSIAPTGGVTGISNPSLKATPQVAKSLDMIMPPQQEYAPTETTSRLVVRESNISLLVKDVRQTSDAILDYVGKLGGYMVSSSVTQPEEAPFGTIVVRIPSDKLRETLDYFRGLAIKVSSEYISGYDVTDEYEDINARLATLEKTKARFEQIMAQAVKIEDILRVQQELINLQSQIDNLKGRQLYLEQTAKLARVTIYLSTDEMALPYTPSETFRPTVIVKMAWRSLVLNLRKIATALIWITIYAVIWVPILIAIILVRRWMARKSSKV